jgi:hypothetical protein
MDWKYKHFNHEAIFKASLEDVLEASRTVVSESFGGFEDISDGFTAKGFSGWHSSIATIRLTSTQDGTRLAVELLVERAAMRGYMLVDIGGYYNIQIDKWFTRIAQRLDGTNEPILVRKTTLDSSIQRGCLMGCFVYLVVGVCLVIFAIPVDHALSPQSSQGPFSLLASALGLLAGIGAFLYVRNPEASTSKSVREWLHRIQSKERQ